MLDVGHVAQILLGPNGPPRFRNALARVMGADETESLSHWLPLFVALHDIAKISAPFQGQARQPRTEHERARLESEGFIFGSNAVPSYRHEKLGAVFIQDVLPQLEIDIDPAIITVLRDAIGGHHGRFPTPIELIKARDYCLCDEPSMWAEMRISAYEVLREQLAPSRTGGTQLPRPINISAAAGALAGFIILCDWIGSDERWFELTAPVTVEWYRERSRERAHRAVIEVDLSDTRQPLVYNGFSSIYPNRSPRPLQLAVDEIPEEFLRWPCLIIMEAPTGEGKTEAALALAHRMIADGPSDELYFALPTTATSNQMFSRVHSYLQITRVGHAPVKLIHGQSFLTEDDLRLSLQGDADTGQSDAASSWFAPKKRALLAPFGVGTVDQVELATLNAKHYMLRLIGLAGKVVIIDEIHAYDTYMSTILEHVLCWMASLGSSVILLSATLPLSRHESLVRAFNRGVAAPESGDAGLPDAQLPYPSLATYSNGAAHHLFPPASQPQRSLTLEFIADASPDCDAMRLIELVRDGGAACRICNTVADAQRIFSAVERLAPSSIRTLLLHSRFPLDERQRLEAEITRGYGPNSDRTEQDASIVVGTQVLEQSLDLDFDVMVTDMAPIDLLLQRAGRVWRHDRGPRNGRSRAMQYIQLPREDNGMPRFGSWSLIYDEFILWRTVIALESRADASGNIEIRLPADYRTLIQSIYDAPPDAPSGTKYREQRNLAYQRHRVDQESARGDARLRLTPDPEPTSSIIENMNTPFEESEDGGQQGWGIARTRQGESITVIPLYRHGNALSLDSQGAYLLEGPYDRDCQFRLLRRSIPVPIQEARQRLAHHLREEREQGPRWFRDASLLRWALPLFLDIAGEAHYDDTVLRLDPNLGLVMEKEDRA